MRIQAGPKVRQGVDTQSRDGRPLAFTALGSREQQSDVVFAQTHVICSNHHEGIPLLGIPQAIEQMCAWAQILAGPVDNESWPRFLQEIGELVVLWVCMVLEPHLASGDGQHHEVWEDLGP